MNTFLGRDDELVEFRQLIHPQRAILATCQGRRRIGKSTFIRQCGTLVDHFYSISGLPPQPDLGKQDQLENFSEALAREFGVPELPLESWQKAFHFLSTLLPQKGKILVLLDEISWMSIGDRNFAGHLKNAWDSYFSQHPNLVLVLCGSVSSWIEENILNSTGFVGRISWQFRLGPLPLHHCNSFWTGREKNKAKPTPTRDKLRLLSITGGVPRYLEEIDPRRSAEQNVERLCFHKSGLLFNEFDQIFHDIFTRKADSYREIVRALVDGPRTVLQISKTLGRISGGSLSAALHDLEGAGFIAQNRSFNPDTAKDLQRTLRFRLSDNYLRFYLKYVEPKRTAIKKGIYQRVPLEALEAWDSIMGLQFENLIHNSRDELLSILGLGNTTIKNLGPYYQTQTQRRKACQIDLLIRTGASLYIIEAKARKKVPTSVIDEVRQKIDRLKVPRSLPVRTVLAYEGELEPGIRNTDFFDHLVSFEQLLTFKQKRRLHA